MDVRVNRFRAIDRVTACPIVPGAARASCTPGKRAITTLSIGLCFAMTLSATEPSVPGAAHSSPMIEVLLRDQRYILGQVDHRTDDEVLWVRVQRNSVTLSTGFTWDLVEMVRVNDRPYSAAEFQEIARSLIPPDRPALPASQSIRQSTHQVLRPALPPRPSGRIQSLDIYAEVGNWDRDADVDGVILRVFPLDVHGRIVAADGSVSVALLAARQNGGEAPDFARLGQWSQRVRPSDFQGNEGAVYYLPMPDGFERDFAYQSQGLVQAELNGRGQGSFEAETPIRLRRYYRINPTRW